MNILQCMAFAWSVVASTPFPQEEISSSLQFQPRWNFKIWSRFLQTYASKTQICTEIVKPLQCTAFARSVVASATFSQEAIISGSAPTLVQLPHPIKIFVVIPSWPLLQVEKPSYQPDQWNLQKIWFLDLTFELRPWFQVLLPHQCNINIWLNSLMWNQAGHYQPLKRHLTSLTKRLPKIWFLD